MKTLIFRAFLAALVASAAVPDLKAQAEIQINIETKLPVSISQREDFLAINHTPIDFPEGADSHTFTTEGTQRILVNAGDNARLFLIRPGHSYRITATDTLISIDADDPFHDTFDAAREIFSGYTLYRIPDDSLLIRLAEIQLRFDSIRAAHPDDTYLSEVLEYYLARMSINPCIQSERGPEVSAYFQSMEDRLVRNAPFLPENPFYTYFLQSYYRWKPNIVAFADSELPRGTSMIRRLEEAFEKLDNDTAAQMAMVYIAHGKYKGEGSRDAEDYRRITDSIADNALHSLTEKTAREVLANMDRLSKGLEVSDYEFTDADGRKFSLSDLRGEKHVLLDFWFVGCGPCLKDVPELKALSSDFAERLEIIAVNPLQPIEKVTPYRDKHDIPYAMVVPDRPGDIKSEFNVSSYPTYIVIGPDGRTALFAGSDLSAVRNLLETRQETDQKASPIKM